MKKIMTKKQVIYLDGGWETCPNCGYEMHIGDCFKVHKCLICGHPILPCDICKMGKTVECFGCPLSEEYTKKEYEWQQ